MSGSATPHKGPNLEIVCTVGTCIFCNTGATNVGEPILERDAMERKKDGSLATGKVPIRFCPVCRSALREIYRVVPIELEELACPQCERKDLKFALSSVKPNRAKEPTDWKFDLEGMCRACNAKTFTQSITELLRLKRIKVSPSGVDLWLK
jgi:hypothetical protein